MNLEQWVRAQYQFLGVDEKGPEALQESPDRPKPYYQQRKGFREADSTFGELLVLFLSFQRYPSSLIRLHTYAF